MRIHFDNGVVRKFGVGDMLPFGPLITKVEWDFRDILPDPVKFSGYMKTVVHPRFSVPETQIHFSAEATGRKAMVLNRQGMLR